MSSQKIASRQNHVCTMCGESLYNGEEIHIHHKTQRSKGGKNTYSNLEMMHLYCHQQKPWYLLVNCLSRMLENLQVWFLGGKEGKTPPTYPTRASPKGQAALGGIAMKCPRCESTHIRKNGRQRGQENYMCVNCKRQFIEYYDQKGYTEDIKSECLEMYVNGLGFRAIERVKKVHHTTIINWVKQVVMSLHDTPYKSEIPEVTEVDELETFLGLKNQDLAVDRS